MIGSALVALALLYSAIPGGWNEILQRHGGFGISDFFTTGLDPAKHGWHKIAGMFAIESPSSPAFSAPPSSPWAPTALIRTLYSEC